jgi:hypothetical protein
VWLLFIAGCLDELEPDVGPPVRTICSNADSDPSTPIRFQTDIRDGLFARADVHCIQCHTATGSTPIGLVVGGLDLASYDTLRRGGFQSGTDIVRPGDPCNSILLRKLDIAPPFGGRMPLDGPPYASMADLQRIADWITEGAQDN